MTELDRTTKLEKKDKEDITEIEEVESVLRKMARNQHLTISSAASPGAMHHCGMTRQRQHS